MSKLLFATTITTTCHEYIDTSRKISYRVILTVDAIQAMRKDSPNTLSFYGFKIPMGWQLIHSESTQIFELTEAISLSKLQNIIEQKSL